ncbi:MAG: TonB-dependent receptor plug domain-containing protein [Bacteroidales bacterium]
MRHILMVILALGMYQATRGQTHVVSGQVTAFNQYPLLGVEVSAKKSGASALTDSLGQFSLVCERNDMIKIKSKAFRSVVRKVGPDQDSLRVNLVFVDSKKNQDLAVGYGYMRPSDLTFAVSHLQQENNEYCNYDNIFDLIRGRFPGVRVEEDGATGAVYIRGNQSITMLTEAMYVVDGSTTSSIDWVIPCDVRSIDVIKDGMAAIYGSRATGGVVLIETKRRD